MFKLKNLLICELLFSLAFIYNKLKKYILAEIIGKLFYRAKLWGTL